MANIIKFTVGGLHYAITSEDSEEYIMSLGRELERKLTQLQKENPRLSTTMVAVLAALNAADGQKKAEQQADRLQRELTDMTEQCALARGDADRFARMVTELQAKLC